MQRFTIRQNKTPTVLGWGFPCLQFWENCKFQRDLRLTSIFPADKACASMKFRRGSTSSPISVVKTSSAAMASSICTRSGAHLRVHGGFPQLLGVHFAQARSAAWRCCGRLRCAATAWLRGSRTRSAPCACRLRRAAIERGRTLPEALGGARQHAVVGAVDEVRVDDADAHVAVVHALDRQAMTLGGSVELGHDFHAVAADRVAQRRPGAWPSRRRLRPCPG